MTDESAPCGWCMGVIRLAGHTDHYSDSGSWDESLVDMDAWRKQQRDRRWRIGINIANLVVIAITLATIVIQVMTVRAQP
jgi:hypothetical protein